jgi:hypothetical protein
MTFGCTSMDADPSLPSAASAIGKKAINAVKIKYRFTNLAPVFTTPLWYQETIQFHFRHPTILHKVIIVNMGLMGLPEEHSQQSLTKRVSHIAQRLQT